MSVDRGCHVANACRTSGKVTTPLVQLVQLIFHVKLHEQTLRTFSDFQLVLYASSDMHPLMLCCAVIQNDRRQQVAMHVRHGAHTLYVRLFGSRLTDGLWAQELLASGSTVRNDYPFSLSDVDANSTAVMQVAQFPFETSPSPAFALSRAATAMIQQVNDAEVDMAHGADAAGLYCAATDHFPTVKVHLDTVRTLPIGWFAFHATRMQASSADVTAYFQRLLDVAERLKLPGSCDAQLLADMLTLPSLAWVYRNDTDSFGKDGEYWASLWSNPPGSVRAFDCEDGAKALLELFHVLCGVPLLPTASKQLVAMQSLAQKYRAFLAIGELYQPGASAPRTSRTGARTAQDYVMHCYCVLLPDAQPHRPLPPITIDSTSFSPAAWTFPTLMRAPRDLSTVDTQRHPLACLRTAPASNYQQGMYGALVSLMTSQRGRRTEHYLMKRVNAYEFFKAPDLARAKCCYSHTYEEAESAFKDVLRCTPGALFPDPCDVKLVASVRLPRSYRETLLPSTASATQAIALSKYDHVAVLDEDK